MESTGVSALIRDLRPRLLGSRSQRHHERSRELARRHRSNRGIGPPGAPSSAERSVPGRGAEDGAPVLERLRRGGLRDTGGLFRTRDAKRRNAHERTAGRDHRPARRADARPDDERAGGADLPDDVVRVRRHPARRRPVRARGAGQHLHADHEPDLGRARAARRRARGRHRRGRAPPPARPPSPTRC